MRVFQSTKKRAMKDMGRKSEAPDLAVDVLGLLGHARESMPFYYATMGVTSPPRLNPCVQKGDRQK